MRWRIVGLKVDFGVLEDACAKSGGVGLDRHVGLAFVEVFEYYSPDAIPQERMNIDFIYFQDGELK